MKDPYSAYRVLIASDVSDGRDGIGIEVYLDDECLIDIFRDELIRFNRTVEDHLIPIDISKDDTCPTIKTLITKYENYYAQDDTTIIIIFICILLCWVCSKSR